MSLQIVCYLYTWKKWNEKFLLPQNSSPSYIRWLLKMTKLDIFLESARKLGVIYVSLGSLIQSFTNVKHGSAEGCAKLWAAEHLKQPSPNEEFGGNWKRRKNAIIWSLNILYFKCNLHYACFKLILMIFFQR